jgi:hypothetical protein
MIESLTEMRCCSHVPDECAVRVVQENSGAPPKLTFKKMIPNGVMRLSFGCVEVFCPACWLLKSSLR